MSRAIVIPFCRYHPHVGEFYKVYFKNLLKNLKYWQGEFDRLYLIDQDWGFSDQDANEIVALFPSLTILKSPVSGHHWVQFKWTIPQIKEDYILFMDNDVVFYRKGIVDYWFKQAEAGSDVVTAFDGSGGLKEQVQTKYSFMKDLGTRMGSYYFILSKKLLDSIPNFNFEPITYTPGTYLPELNYETAEGDWSDSFGLFTLKWLSRGADVSIITDDRSSIYLEGDVFTKDPEKPLNLGYYHIRNGNLPVYQLTSKYCGHEEDYKHSLAITPRRETLRILAWYEIISGPSRKIDGILKDLLVEPKLWEQYINEFMSYHGIWGR